MDIPIVLIHQSDHACLEYSLRAAKHHHSDVTLITDITSDKYAAYCKIVDIHSLRNNKTEALKKDYKHLSTNSYEFEYICIERWFLLLEHMQRNKIEKIIYIDSDVLVYDNLSEVIQQYYSDCDICLCTPDYAYEQMIWVSSGHTFYTTLHALEQVCDFILEIYAGKMDELMVKWNWHKQHNEPGGINDMTLLYLFQRSTKLKTGNFLKVVNDAFCFDSHINTSMNETDDEYEMKSSFLLGHSIKKIVFKSKQPYSRNLKSHKLIRFVTLHCQSDAKRIMPLLIKDNKTNQQQWSDFLKVLRLTYSAIRRILTDKIKSFLPG